ncbi:hypothetical protein JCM5350_002499 [Sporobolomyces pararoseus]
MISISAVALSQTDVLQAILQHGADDSSTSSERSTFLTTCSLICRDWVEPAQKMLYKNVLLYGGDEQLEQWLYTVKKRNYRSDTLALLDPYPFKEGGKWSYEMIRKVLVHIIGVRELTLGLHGQSDLPPEWMTLNSLSSGPFAPSIPTTLPSFSLTALQLEDSLPQLDRNWRHTCSLLTRRSMYRPVCLEILEFDGFENSFLSLLAPPLPLTPNPGDSSQGSLLSSSSTITTLRIPNLSQTSDSYNFAIFASTASILSHLIIDELTPHAFEIISLLRFLPGLAMLSFSTFVSLPWAGFLPEIIEERFARDGKGDVFRSFMSLIERDELPHLQQVVVIEWKMFSQAQFDILRTLMEEKGIRLIVLSSESLPWSEQEAIEHQRLRHELEAVYGTIDPVDTRLSSASG